MARFVSLMAPVVAMLLLGSSAAHAATDDAEMMQAFGDFRVKFNKQYRDDAEVEMRYSAFKRNMRRAAEEQSRNPHATFGVTEYSDLTSAEFKTRHNAEEAISEALARAGRLGGKGTFRHRERATAKDVEALPTSFDWRTKGMVTPVKNQGQCGSCWAFSAIANIESMWAIAGYPLTSLSEQYLVSCDNFFSYGCNGGGSILADWWINDERNGTVYTEASYPYVSGDGISPACNETDKTIGAVIAGGEVLLPWDARGMELFVATRGPLSVAVDAESFQSYTSGVMTSCISLMPDHQVTVVGYGTSSDNIPYWIIKNSWGATWGEEGYIRLERGKNLCQVELLATSASVIPKSESAQP